MKIKRKRKNVERAKTGGARRSPKWRGTKKKHYKKKKNRSCAFCGRKSRLQVHHIIPFYLAPQWENLLKNLITLCWICHFLAGHLRYWKSFNENIRRDAKRFLKKIKNRP